MLRFFVPLVFAALLVSGCVAPPEGMPVIPVIPDGKDCRMVTEEVPVVEVVCGDIMYTEQVCEIRDLGYTTNLLPKVDLCIGDGACSGKQLSECPNCNQAMTRCVLQITNNEEQKSGTWTVGANYTLGNWGFIKDPITHTIRPGETVNFDFYQIYSPGHPINSASCNLFVISEPRVEVCHEVTRSREECREISTTMLVEYEVCE